MNSRKAVNHGPLLKGHEYWHINDHHSQARSSFTYVFILAWGWRNGSAVETACCSYNGPKLESSTPSGSGGL